MQLFERARNYIARQRVLREARQHFGKGSTGFLGAADRGPAAVGRLVVETRTVDPVTGDVGPWQKRVDDSNLVVTQAETIMAQMSITAANSGFSYIELGGGAPPPAVVNPPVLGDITLQATTGQRKAVSGTASGNVVTLEALWDTTEGNGNTYVEAGLFNGLLGSGTMFARKVFAGIAKTSSFQMKFTWYITFLVQSSGTGDCAGVALLGPSTVATKTVYTSPSGGEKSIAATFDFAVGADNVDVFLRGQRLVPGVHYNEAAAGALVAPIGGPTTNKGINLVGWSLITGDVIFLIQRTLG